MYHTVLHLMHPCVCGYDDGAGTLTANIRIQADEARRLKSDTAFTSFLQEVRDDQVMVFTTSGASDVEAREAAHGIVRALEKIEMKLDAAITAETFLDRKEGK